MPRNPKVDAQHTVPTPVTPEMRRDLDRAVERANARRDRYEMPLTTAARVHQIIRAYLERHSELR